MNDMSSPADIAPLMVRSGDDRATYRPTDLITALTADGDSRLAVIHPHGTNKYLCPPTPAPNLICASSCTASPITPRGFQRAADFHADLAAQSSRQRRTDMLHQCRQDIAARLLRHFDATELATAILCPSGTDALLAASLLVAQEQRDGAITAILPQPSETGTGVPLAATLCRFDGQDPDDVPLLGRVVNTISIPLRRIDGTPRPDDEVAAAYAAAARSARGHRVVYLTHSTKTGLIAPVTPPKGADVIVDACQARIEPAMVARYLRNFWPVVVTGSKFFGGPAFSGAVLYPTARLAQLPPDTVRQIAEPAAGSAEPGTLLRWLAAMDAIEAVAGAADLPDRIRTRAAAIERHLTKSPALVPVPGLAGRGPGWSQLPTIFSVAVRDPRDPQRLLPASELRRLYAQLASQNVLLGQPVELGRFGALRIAIGARDLLPDAPEDGNLPAIFAALRQAASGR